MTHLSPPGLRRAIPRTAAIAAIAVLVGVTGVAGAGPASAGDPPPSDPPIVGEKQLFVGDYESGDFNQWSNCQSVSVNSTCRDLPRNRSMRILNAPDAHQGKHAAAFAVQSGDVPSFGGGERAEVSSSLPASLVHEGDERTYQWSMKFPNEIPKGSSYFIVMQWHSAEGSPPLAVEVNKSGALEFTIDGDKSIPFTPIRKGEWADYTLHVMFSKDKKKGYVEGWVNGKRATPRTPTSTMRDAENYLKMGIYRGSGSKGSAEVWQDGLRVTGPADSRSGAPRRPPLCIDETPPGTPCTPPN